MHFARALVGMGIDERSVVLIQGVNTPEHVACIMGTILANCVFSSIYPDNSPDVCLHEVRHSKAKVICCDTYERLKSKYLKNPQIFINEGIKAFILFSEGVCNEPTECYPKVKGQIPVYTWSQLMSSASAEIGDGVIFNRIYN